MKTSKLLIWVCALIMLTIPVMGALTDGLWQYYNMTTTNSSYYDTTDQLAESGTITQESGCINNECYLSNADGECLILPTNAQTALDNTKNWSVNMWIKRTGNPGSAETARMWGFADDKTISLAYQGSGRPDPNKMEFNWKISATTYDLIGDSALNVWEMWTVVWHHTDNVSMYKNGTLVQTEIIHGTADAAAGLSDRLGGTPHDGCAQEAKAYMDEFMVYNRSLSTAEMASLLTSFYPFGGGSPSSTDVDFTIDDSWTAGAISNFTVDVSWSNGSSTTHSTTNGTVSLINITAGNINVTYYGMTNYFNKTISDTLTVNTSNSVSTETYQAVLCLNATSKVSGTPVIPNSFTIGSHTVTSCFNISAGTHNVKATKTGWFSKNQTVIVTALSNATQTIYNMSYANLTIRAIDGTTNASLSNYNLTIKSISVPAWTGEVASSVTNYSFYLINGTYNVTISKPGYATTTAQANITVAGHKNYTFTLYKSNSVTISIRDEITNNLITDNVTVRWSDNTTTWENVTSTGGLFVHNITAGNYTLLFYSSNYSTRTYQITVGPSSTQFLTAYMISSTYSTIFTIKDIDTGSILDGVAITMYKLINSSWTTVESKVSDISGKAQFYYDPIANYRFYLSNPTYNDYVFYLNPILFSTYDVFMTRTSVLNYSVDFDNIGFIYSPTQFENNQNVSFNFLISSPSGNLIDYGIKLTYPGGSDSDSGVNAIGEQLSADVNITGATTFDVVVLEFNYTTTLAGSRSYTFHLPISLNVSSGTWMTNKDKTYGLGLFERLLIATLIVLFVVGIATMVGQALPGVAIGLFVFGFLVYIGFVPLWAILPSMLVGVLFLVWKSGGY